MDNRSMTTNSKLSVSKPCNTFANIFYVLTCYGHNNIAMYRLFLLFSVLGTYMGNNIIYK